MFFTKTYWQNGQVTEGDRNSDPVIALFRADSTLTRNPLQIRRIEIHDDVDGMLGAVFDASWARGD